MEMYGERDIIQIPASCKRVKNTRQKLVSKDLKASFTIRLCGVTAVLQDLLSIWVLMSWTDGRGSKSGSTGPVGSVATHPVE